MKNIVDLFKKQVDGFYCSMKIQPVIVEHLNMLLQKVVDLYSAEDAKECMAYLIEKEQKMLTDRTIEIEKILDVKVE